MKKYIFAMMVGFLIVSAHGAHASSFDFGTATLRQGVKNSYVTSLQTALNQFSGANLIADGSFGLKTKYAVIAFQASQGLKSDGIFGTFSRARLLSIFNTTNLIVEPVTQTCTPRQITSIVSYPNLHNVTSSGIPDFEFVSPTAGSVYHVGDTIKIKWIVCQQYGQLAGATVWMKGNLSQITIGTITSLRNNEEYDYVIPASALNSGSTFTISGFDGAMSDSSANGDTTGSFTILP